MHTIRQDNTSPAIYTPNIPTFDNNRHQESVWTDVNERGQEVYTIASVCRYMGTSANGDHYEGEWKDGVQHGQGTATYANGDRYEGNWHDGKWHGQGIIARADGGCYKGEWKGGLQHGQGVATYANGDHCENGGYYDGEWKDGKQHGHAVMKYPNGDRYDGECKGGKRHGQGVYKYANGEHYEGEWNDDEHHGQGIMAYADGTIFYKGEWKDGNIHGQGIVTYADDGRYEGECKDDKRHGQGIMTYADGGRYDGEWKNDKRHGHGVYNHADGSQTVGTWKNGMKRLSNRQRKKKNRKGCVQSTMNTTRKSISTSDRATHIAVDDGPDHLQQWRKRIAYVHITFNQYKRQKGSLVNRCQPVSSQTNPKRATYRPMGPMTPTSQSDPDGRASVVETGVLQKGRQMPTKRADLRRAEFTRREVLSTRQLSPEEREFVISRPGVFQFQKSRDGRDRLRVDLHQVFDHEGAISTVLSIVKKLLSPRVVEKRMTDKNDPVYASRIEVITGKGQQVLYKRVKKSFENWRDEGCSAIMRRFVSCY